MVERDTLEKGENLINLNCIELQKKGEQEVDTQSEPLC